MASLKDLPIEVLTDIISSLNRDYHALWACSLVSKRFHQVASPRLYEDVDLQFDETSEGIIDEKCAEKQERMLNTIAENPGLGSLVRRFRNHLDQSVWGSFEDATQFLDPGLEIFEKLENMKNLTSAFLIPSPVTNYIIENLPDYPHLRDLTIRELHPEAQIWPIRPTVLRSLKWTIPATWNPSNGFSEQRNPLDQVEFLERVVRITCPELESLHVVVIQGDGRPMPIAVTERAINYLSMTPKFVPKLQHFGFSHQSYTDVVSTRKKYLDLINQYRSTLRSLAIPILAWDTGTLNFLERVWTIVPTITTINLVSIPGQKPTANCISFFEKISNFLANPKYEIESFTMMNIGTEYSQEIGEMFSSWKSLKTLRLRDAENIMANFEDEGCFEFKLYEPQIIDFITALPPSIESLYLGISGWKLISNPDMNFDYRGKFITTSDLNPGIFHQKPRLHTLDLHAWVIDYEGNTNIYPKKVIFMRRVPPSTYPLTHPHPKPNPHRDPVPRNRNGKEIWTTRIDFNLEQSEIIPWTEYEEISGTFAGKDADDLWVDFVRENQERGVPLGTFVDKPDYSWPFSWDPVARYGMFTREDGKEGW